MKKKISLAVVMLITALIFLNSLMPGNVSSNQSGFVVKYLYPPFKSIMSINTFTTLIRKMAHFTEYFILGISLNYLYKNTGTTIKLAGLVLLHGFLTASVDETIQLFVPGRAGAFTDVLIDTSGVIFSILMMFMIKKNKEIRTS